MTRHSPFPANYLRSRAIQGPWRIDGEVGSGFAGAVVIPALAESANLFATLHSLAANPPQVLARVLVLVVVNHREDASTGDKADNLLTLKQLAAGLRELAPLRLAWVDAASPGRELPAKGGGVGLARKIGLDLALARLDFTGQNPLLISLDADTLVEPSYLPVVTRHFRENDRGGAVIPFCHRPAASPEEQEAIDRYELFLRHYVFGLALASSPYAFHTVGSAMACTSSAYVRAGGMNTRCAGEDFYFLQQLHRTSGVDRVAGTMVFPSPRPSHRVPFGTGRTITRAMTDGVATVSFYHPECFHILGQWLSLAKGCTGVAGTELLDKARGISPLLADYLSAVNFPAVWQRLQRHSKGCEAFRKAFHDWFDAFKTLKLIHHLSVAPYPRCEPEDSIPPLLLQAGEEPVAGTQQQLALLRRQQNAALPSSLVSP